MKRAEAFPSKHLKAEDLPYDGITVTIQSVGKELVGEEGDKSFKPVARLVGHTKGLWLNVTNWLRIVDLLGEEDSDRWAGREIPIFPTECDFKGETKPCIRVRLRAPVERPAGAGDSSILAMLHSFADLNVTRLMIEQRLGHSVAEVTNAEREQLRDIHDKMMAGGAWPLARPSLTEYLDRPTKGELIVRRAW
jgi:hypothetical protein